MTLMSERTLWDCPVLSGSDNDFPRDDQEILRQIPAWGRANLISSRLVSGGHAPALDVDLPAMLTDGHTLTVHVDAEEFIMGDEETDEACNTLVSSGLARKVSYLRGSWSSAISMDLSGNGLLIPSKSNGHHHLYIEQRMSWRDYRRALGALSYLCIIQNGYHMASLARRMTMLRTDPLERYGGQLTLPGI